MVEQLDKMHIQFDSINEFCSKDGITLYRIKSGSDFFVLKHFENAEFRREIDNYQILQGLNIPTIKIIANTDEAILMEDITESENYRLADKSDMDDVDIALKLAEWYRQLHGKGKEYIKKHGSGMYSETDCITAENIDFISNRTHTDDIPVWDEIKKNLSFITDKIKQTEKTLTYNDFYYTNMVVAKDKSEAFMFDYNLLGKGFAASDIGNVTCQLSDKAKAAFLEAYGETNPEEQLLYDVTEPIIGLYYASCRENFPEWGKSTLECVKDGRLLNCLNIFLKGN